MTTATADRKSAACRDHDPERPPSRLTGSVHDISLGLWLALAVARATGHGRAGVPDLAVIGVNLAAGTPFALRRLQERRRDAAALASPIAVVAAVIATARGGWSPVAATTLLHLLRWADRRRPSAAARRTRHQPSADPQRCPPA